MEIILSFWLVARLFWHLWNWIVGVERAQKWWWLDSACQDIWWVMSTKTKLQESFIGFYDEFATPVLCCWCHKCLVCSALIFAISGQNLEISVSIKAAIKPDGSNVETLDSTLNWKANDAMTTRQRWAFATFLHISLLNTPLLQQEPILKEALTTNTH